MTRILALVELRESPSAEDDPSDAPRPGSPAPAATSTVPPAVDWAVAWAAYREAEVEFVALRPQMPLALTDSPAFTATSPAALEQALQVQARRALTAAKDVAEAAGVMSHSRTARDDDPAKAVLDVAAHRRCDLIVVASDGRNAVMRLLTGSAIPGLVTTSPLPVLVVPDTAPPPPRLPAGHSPERSSEPATSAVPRVMAVLEDRPGALAAVQRAVALAELLRGELCIVQPTPRELPLALDGSAIVPLADERLSEALRDRAAGRLAEAVQLARDAGVPASTLRVEGAFTGHTLADLVARQGCVMVVVATEGHNAVMRMVVGSIIPGLITHATVPLLIVRDTPPGVDLASGRRRGAEAPEAYTPRA
jgi:nucleotide-binding universal stress UspA family protein